MRIIRGMTWLVFLLFLVLVGPLAVYYGKDSRLHSDRGGFWR